MAEIGRFNTLDVVKILPHGAYLDGGELDTILLPRRYVPEGCAIGDAIEVFIYLDSDDQLIATTETPLAQVGQCAYLKVVDTNRVGAFMDWGLAKDLLVPFNEQSTPMQVGRSYVVHLYIDEQTQRIAASSKLSHFLYEDSNYFKPMQAVELLICGRSDMGYKAVIDDTHLGLLYKSEVLQPLRFGERIQGYIKHIRPDKKINLSLQKQGHQSRDELSEQILEQLRANGGTSTLTDKSPPDAIYQQYKVSKGNYKKALGGLYKKRLIAIEADCIRLSPEPSKS